MEKILLKFNENGYNLLLSQLEQSARKANTLMTDLKTVCNIEITEKILNDVYQMRGEQTAKVIEEGEIPKAVVIVTAASAVFP